jgi:photosystem II stability/assembly factor-like uncharacterized protein
MTATSALKLTLLAALTAVGCSRFRRGNDEPVGWDVQTSGTTASLRGVQAVSENVAWASGAAGTVLRTTDGGATWRRVGVPDADSLDFRDVAAVDSLVAYAMSAGEGERGRARIYKTTDGGRSWSVVLSDTTRGTFFDAVSFWDRNRGVAVSDPVGGRFVVVVTEDGGQTWRRPAATGMPAARPGEAAFAAGGSALTIQPPAHIWFVTGGTPGGRVFRSDDAGRTWVAYDVPAVAPQAASSGLFAIAFKDPQNGVAVGGDYTRPRDGGRGVLVTPNGGVTWLGNGTEAARGYWSGLSVIPGARRGQFVAVGGPGTILTRNMGDGWSRVDSVAYNGVSFAAPNVGWAVGDSGRIARWKRAAPKQ